MTLPFPDPSQMPAILLLGMGRIQPCHLRERLAHYLTLQAAQVLGGMPPDNPVTAEIRGFTWMFTGIALNGCHLLWRPALRLDCGTHFLLFVENGTTGLHELVDYTAWLEFAYPGTTRFEERALYAATVLMRELQNKAATL